MGYDIMHENVKSYIEIGINVEYVMYTYAIELACRPSAVPNA